MGCVAHPEFQVANHCCCHMRLAIIVGSVAQKPALVSYLQRQQHPRLIGAGNKSGGRSKRMSPIMLTRPPASQRIAIFDKCVFDDYFPLNMLLVVLESSIVCSWKIARNFDVRATKDVSPLFSSPKVFGTCHGNLKSATRHACSEIVILDDKSQRPIFWVTTEAHLSIG